MINRITEEKDKRNFKFIESNKNESINYQNPWDTTKAVLRRKFIVTSVYT